MRTFLQVLALLFTLESAIFMVNASLGMSAQDIAGLVGTYVGHNPHLIRSLVTQVTDYRIGTALLLLAFIIQMTNTLWRMRWVDFEVSKKGALLALFVAAIVFLTVYWFGGRSAANLDRTVQEILAPLSH